MCQTLVEPAAPAAEVEAPAPPEPAPRKPTGSAGRVSPDEKRDILLAYLTTPGATISRIAQEYNRNRETVSGLVKGPEGEATRKELQAELVTIAKDRLAGGVGLAAESWVASLELAALRGDHRPSKDLLLHTGVIAPLTDGGAGHGVQVVVCMPGQTDVLPPVMPLLCGPIIDATPAPKALVAADAGRIAELERQIAALQAQLREHTN